ncbi:hypothetical protein KFL_003350070 [Klebsormidium nitens]|uniref:ER membrane protein complex subunit 4 n=1 Tax=Klebsormidium nitens TaxID=105231 RepID=A0A0U9HPB2_KLENI|nr:hypothetical protein KFL_003350070 [Klebsormidium nitens]|eukprot:GAQ87157.1 hypothetical protein KFL_003350070 [Klebsormidium nitens]
MAAKARKWALDFGDTGPSSSRSAPEPLGYNRQHAIEPAEDSSAVGKKDKNAPDMFKLTKAWEVAGSPLKQIGMMAFMMWMSGSTVQIFSIMMTFTGIWQPMQAIRGSAQIFLPFKDARTDVLLPRLAFCGLQLLGMGIALWKLNSLGLLPTSASDWTSSLAVPPNAEFSGGGFPLS